MNLIKSYGTKKDRVIYGNYQVLSPDNILMFRCDDKKFHWYLKRGLAIKISENRIKLIFQPKGLGHHNKPFGLTKLENKCVCCGTTEYLTRHHVVPHEYRKWFPNDIKSHNFHDVLSMCVVCHERYERIADHFKRELSNRFRAPIGGRVKLNRKIIKMSKIASTLLKSSNFKIPKHKIVKMKSKIKKAFYLKKLTNHKLKQISNLTTTVVKKTHGQIVVEKSKSLQTFVEEWRRHFVENNNCQYLPENWNIKHRILND